MHLILALKYHKMLAINIKQLNLSSERNKGGSLRKNANVLIQSDRYKFEDSTTSHAFILCRIELYVNPQ